MPMTVTSKEGAPPPLPPPTPNRKAIRDIRLFDICDRLQQLFVDATTLIRPLYTRR